LPIFKKDNQILKEKINISAKVQDQQNSIIQVQSNQTKYMIKNIQSGILNKNKMKIYKILIN
jgi:hypothetical protein